MGFDPKRLVGTGNINDDKERTRWRAGVSHVKILSGSKYIVP